MYIKSIVVSNFKNLRNVKLDFSKNINCITGNNGTGKTNLLDAVYYLSMTKSYFSSSDRFTYTHGEDQTALHATYQLDDGTEDRVSIYLKKNGSKQVKRNDKVYSRLSEHLGRYPVVMVSPYDTSLINDAAEDRRRFIDMMLSQVDKEYLKRLQTYNHLLYQRNSFLKMPYPTDDLLDTISEQLAYNAVYIYEKRAELTLQLQETVREYYSLIATEREEVSMAYRSDLSKGNLVDLLAQSKERDKFLKYTSVGVHRDDISFLLSDFPIKGCGSQGQQKSFLIALKMAQYTIMKKMCGVAPILLLDDLFDKLDMDRISHLLKIVAGDSFGQIFISDSNKVRTDRLVENVTDDHKRFIMENGECR